MIPGNIRCVNCGVTRTQWEFWGRFNTYPGRRSVCCYVRFLETPTLSAPGSDNS